MKIIDAHIHLCDLSKLHYPWLSNVPAIKKNFLINDYKRATEDYDIESMVFVQCECLPEEALCELDFVKEQRTQDARIKAIVEYAPLEKGLAMEEFLLHLKTNPLIKGVRRMTANEPGLCLTKNFLDAMQLLIKYNLSLDLSIKPFQAGETIALIERCPENRFILDHLGKPDIANNKFEEYKNSIKKFALFPNVVAKRAQWAGDAAMEMAQAFYALDERSNQLSRKLFLDLANWQRTDSAIYNPVPEGGWKNELPAHSLMPLSELWRYFLFTKDTVTVKQVYPALKKYLTVWKIQDNGQLVYRKGGWDWGDWGDNIDYALIQHGWYLLALQTAAKIAALLNEQNDYALFDKKISQLKTFLNSADCWNGKAYRHKDYKGATDDRANALMTMAGVADSSKWNAITKVLTTEEHASPWMEKFVLESLIKMNKPNLALERMKKRYKEMVESKLSTLWEIWEHKEGEVHGNSGYNHGWAGGPLVLLSQYFAGIYPDEQKANGYIIKPMLTGLTSIKTVVPTVNGSVNVSIQQNENSFHLSCVIPNGITATIGLSKQGKQFKEVLCNNSTIAKLRNVKIKGEDAQYYWVEVGDGSYDFKCLEK